MNRQEGERDDPGTTAASSSQLDIPLNRRERGARRGKVGDFRQNVTLRSLWCQERSTEREEGKFTTTVSRGSLPDCEEIAPSIAEALNQRVQEITKSNSMMKRKVTRLEGDLLECETARKAVSLHVNHLEQQNPKLSTEIESIRVSKQENIAIPVTLYGKSGKVMVKLSDFIE